jgi:hypothetical protein
VTEDRTTDRIAALEQARAQIEIALSGDEDWRALRQVAAGSSRRPHERALANNPLYRSWNLLNEAIQDLRAKGARQREGEPGNAPDDLTRIRGVGPALARRLADRGITRYGQIAAWGPGDVRATSEALGLGRHISRQNWIEQAALLELRRPAATEAVPPPANAHASLAPAGAPGVELHHILEHIRNDAARRGEPPSMPRDRGTERPDGAGPVMEDASATTVAVAGQRSPVQQPPEAVAGAAAWESAGTPEPEEATVTIVIREPTHTGPIDDRSGEDEAQRGPLSDQWAAVGAEDSLYPQADGPAEEAEVAIVRHPSDTASARRPRKA